MNSFAPSEEAARGPALQELLEFGAVFNRPFEVVADPDLTIHEKRAILASWASDACAVEGVPALRKAPGSARSFLIDEILEALAVLDANVFDAPEFARRLRGSGGEVAPSAADSLPSSARTVSPPSPNTR
jgi:hypothetical protein